MSQSVKITALGAEENSDQRVCPLCLKSKAKYTCPRCNSPYCSVECYRSEKHMNCSESFYKDCFMEGLKECSADASEKQKVIEMLKRTEEDSTLEDLELEDDLHERLHGLDLERDIDKVWDKLTLQEKQDFEAMASDGRLGNLLEVWTPWWLKSRSKVTEVKDNSSSKVKGTGTSDDPVIVPEIANMSTLLKTKPSAEVKYNVVNILYCYVFVSRLHNGDHVAMATESVQDFLKLSEVMGKGHSCGSVEEAIQLCLTKLIGPNSSFESTVEWNMSMIKDVEKIIGDKSFSDDPLHCVLCAVSDVYYMLKAAYKYAKSVKGTVREKEKDLVKEHKKQLFQCLKKTEFLLSWCQSYGMALIELLPEIKIVYALLASEYEEMNQSKKSLESQWGGQIQPRKKKLIEEV